MKNHSMHDQHREETRVVKVIKLYYLSLTNRPNKLECFSLECFLSKSNFFEVRSQPFLVDTDLTFKYWIKLGSLSDKLLSITTKSVKDK
jgi:hypothetical protein